MGLTAWPTDLDPACNMGKTRTRTLFQVFDTLLYTKNDGTVTSYVCESWDMKDDVTAEFVLKDGITFHNGDPLTAEDVKFTLERLLNDTEGYVDANVAALYKNFDKIEADGQKLTITLKAADPILFGRLSSILGMYIVPQNYVQEVGNEAFAQQPIGTGPYKLTGPITAENIELTYYEGYDRMNGVY